MESPVLTFIDRFERIRCASNPEEEEKSIILFYMSLLLPVVTTDITLFCQRYIKGTSIHQQESFFTFSSPRPSFPYSRVAVRYSGAHNSSDHEQYESTFVSD